MIVVVGTGTDVGKTFVTCALLAALRRGGVAVGAWKPVASGIEEAQCSPDSEAHAVALGGPVPPPLYALRPPLSPHLAARQSGVTIEIEPIVRQARELATGYEVFLLETAGGLFSPLSENATNADLARALGGTLLLVAPDRIGVLHDVGAARRAARAEGLSIDAVALSTPEFPDSSTGTNAAEIERVVGLRVAAVFPRSTAADPAHEPMVRRLHSALPDPRR